MNGWGALALPSDKQKHSASLAEPMEDAALVTAARAGDEVAFEQIIHRYTPALYRWCAG